MLLTGVSGTGKSTTLAALGGHGLEIVDTDDPGWRKPADGPAPAGAANQPDWIWDEDRIGALLDAPHPSHLVVAGCVENQGRFLARFDHVVMLTAPPEVLERRLVERTTNPYGKAPEERERVREEISWVEPLLRQRATRVVDTTAPLDEVVALLLADLG